MIEAFKGGEDAQLEGCARYINANSALRTAFIGHNWARVAFFYNGRDYAKNNYATNLEAGYAQFKQSPPDVDVRAGQARLAYLGFNTKGIDGVMGDGTRSAIIAFQQRNNLSGSGTFDAKTQTALKTAAGV